VSAMQATERRSRIIYGVAACVLLAACFATFRKSALLAPMSVIATIAYYRRRELLKLSPLGLVLVVLIHILAPGALGKTTGQFDPAQLGVTTVSSRTADYDAIRPDLWTHLLFGRGWGSYDHVTYRILDSELLRRGLEMGVLGFLAYLFMIVSVIGTARATVATRDPVWAPLGLMGAAAAVSFLVVSSLFDVMAFPHATYIFLCTAALVAVGAKQGQVPAEIAALRADGTPTGDLPPGAAPPERPPAEAPRPERVATPVGV
jgi:O-antigen ligase